MQVYVITRFSIFDANVGGFQITRDTSAEAYEHALFDRGRLEHKFEAFEKITLPSIVNQTSGNWEWHIYSSDRLPSVYDNRLELLVKKSPKIKIFKVKDFQEFSEQVVNYPYGEDFATCRLDDDDGLSDQYVEKLQQYSAKKGSIVSFPIGRKVSIRDGRILLGVQSEQRLVSAGMAAIGMNIHLCGNHRHVDRKFDVVYDLSPAMYQQDCSEFCDTKRQFGDRKRQFQSGTKRLSTAIRRRVQSKFRQLGYRIAKKTPTVEVGAVPLAKTRVRVVNSLIGLVGYKLERLELVDKNQMSDTKSI